MTITVEHVDARTLKRARLRWAYHGPKLRPVVFERAGYYCQECGRRESAPHWVEEPDTTRAEWMTDEYWESRPRSGWCYYNDDTVLEVDHIVPLACGGSPIDLANLQALCQHCNRRKGAR